MGEHPEYRQHSLDGASDSLVVQLQRLGDEGWELLESKGGGFGCTGYDVLLRREAHGLGGTWEYTSFNVESMPREWWDHVHSCGWIIVEHAYYRYYGCVLHFAKRQGYRRGTDDGDIWARLKDVGQSELFSPGSVKEILQVKWEQSQVAGENIGTYRAVRYWLSHRIASANA